MPWKSSYFIRPIQKNVLVNCWPFGKYVNLLYMYSILGRGSFYFNHCLNLAWHGDDQFVALLRWYGSPGFFDSGLQLIFIFLVSCFSFSSWQYTIDSLWGSGLVSLLASKHPHQNIRTSVVNRSTSADLYRVQIIRTNLRCNFCSPWVSLFLTHVMRCYLHRWNRVVEGRSHALMQSNQHEILGIGFHVLRNWHSGFSGLVVGIAGECCTAISRVGSGSIPLWGGASCIVLTEWEGKSSFAQMYAF